MRILMLGNSLTTANHLPDLLAELTGAEVVCHARGGARLAEQLNPKTVLGARTQAALQAVWDYVVLQEMSHGPCSAPDRFLDNVSRLCTQIRACGAVPVLYATWAYRRGSAKLTAKGWDYDQMAHTLSAAYRQAARQTGAILAPVGDRFYALSDTHDLYAPDGVHPNPAGTRVAAETLAAAMRAAPHTTQGGAI